MKVFKEKLKIASFFFFEFLKIKKNNFSISQFFGCDNMVIFVAKVSMLVVLTHSDVY